MHWHHVSSDAAQVVEKGGPPAVATALGILEWRRRRRRRRQRTELVWDEILGHEQAPGVLEKPSLATRVVQVEEQIKAHAEADLAAQEATHNAIRHLAMSLGHPEAVDPWVPPLRAR